MKNHIIISEIIKPFKKKIGVNGDKSISIRCVLMASQAIGTSKIYNLLDSEDVNNSLVAIKKLGINYKKFDNYHKIFGLGINGYDQNKSVKIYAGNSGTLARLILGLLVNTKKKIIITGDNSLSKRDFSRVTEPLKGFGANIISKNNSLPVQILGSEFLRPISYIEKKGSAQCKSSIMLASLKTSGTTFIKAKKSRNHTELLFKYLKIPIIVSSRKKYDLIKIKGPSNFKGFEYKVPGDMSSCSFFIVLALLSKNSEILIKNININETRTGIIKILNKMNAKILFKNKKKYKGELIGDILVKSKENLRGIVCPKKYNSSAIDEFLIIFLVAAKAKGVSSFKNLEELNKKESPRLEIALKFLDMIGIKYIRYKNDIKIYGNPNLTLSGNYIIKNFRKDHRVFMMSCIAALTFGGKWKIHDKDSINSSFPNFLHKIQELGAKIN